MNYQNRYLSLVEFLKSYSEFWRYEVLNDYPKTIEAYPHDWIELLDSKTDKELHEIDGKNNPASLRGSPLAEFIEEAQSLIDWPRMKLHPKPLPSWAYMKVKEKKRHEIDCLREVLLPLKEKTGFIKLTDIGGGVGNLSRIMAQYHGLPATCLDMSLDFIEKGKKRKTKYPMPEGAAEVSFEQFKFGYEPFEKVQQFFNQETLSLGLHTCGPLALEHINTFHKTKSRAMLNFGCCYSKLNPSAETNISMFAKDNPIPYSLHGLTLATRSHSTMTFDEFKLKERVKSYRYTLHLFLKDVLGHTEFASVGEAHPRIYWDNFSSYALLKLKEMEVFPLPSSNELNNFYEKSNIKKQVREMFLANIIRWQLGRAVEMSLLLDRCLYLEEKGYKVELLQIFNEEISPRNFGILSYKKA